jgi:hypothetical protein
VRSDWRHRRQVHEQRKHIGSSLDDLLAQDGTLADAEAAALKRVIARQVGLARAARRRPLRSPRTGILRSGDLLSE